MRKSDGRRLDEKDQYKRRKKIIQLRQKGKNNKEISELLGCCPTHVSTIWQKYVKAKYDEEVLKPGVRGRKEGDKRRLSPDNEKLIKNILLKKEPANYNINYYFWSRKAIKIIIKKEIGIVIPIRLVTDYIKRWGLSVQKPIKSRQINLNNKYLNWLKHDYKLILKETKKNKQDIVWISTCFVGDEFFNDPIQPVKSVNKAIILSAMTNHGDIRFLLYKKRLTEVNLRHFIKLLHADIGKKLYLIFYDKYLNKFINIKLGTQSIKKNIELLFLDFSSTSKL